MKRFLLIFTGLLLLTAGLQGSRAFAQQASPLESALSFKERPRGKSDSIAVMQHPAELDYTSLLIIEPDTSLLKTMGATNEAVLPPLSSTDRVRLENLPALLEAAHAYVEEAAGVAAAVEEARLVGVEQLTNDAILVLQNQIANQAKLALDIQNPLFVLAEARAREMHPNDSRAVDQAVNDMTNDIFTDDAGRPVLLNLPRFEAFLRDQLREADRQIQEDTVIANRQGTARFRMRAWLLQAGKEPVAIGISDYDEIENLAGPKRSRITFRMTPDEQARLAQDLALSATAATFINGVRDNRSSLRTGLQNLKQTAFQDLKDLKDLPVGLLSNVDSTLQLALTHARNFTQSEDTLSQLSELNGFLGEFQTNLTTIKTSFDQLKTGSTTPDALIQQALALPTTIANTIQFTIGYAREVKTNRTRLEMLEAVLKKPTVPRQSFTVRALSLLPNTRTQLDAFVDGELAEYIEAAKLIKGLFNRGQIVHMADAFDDVPVDTRVRTLDLKDVIPGTINLQDTPADRGDRVRVRAELITFDALNEEKILETSSQTFGIERFGLTSEFSGHLIFTNRLQEDSTSFDVATSASWTLHYRPRTGPSASILAKAWAFLDPGFGINVAALHFNPSNFEVGLGLHASLFDDLLSAGYGYNLLADADQSYYYLGIGILEAISSVGGLVGGSPR